MDNEHYRRLNIRRKQEFHRTNQPWNELKLNTSWVIGSLNYLFKQSKATTWEQWQQFYIASGEERRLKLLSLDLQKQNVLNDIQIPYQRKRHLIQQLSQEEEQLNTMYGRTNSDFEQIAKIFQRELNKRNFIPRLSRNELLDFVKIRVIDETFIGFERERKTIEQLQKHLPHLCFKDVTYEDDVNYAIDTEIFHDNQLICAVQVKSLSYMESQNKFIHSVKKMNRSKNEKYEQTYSVPVLYAFSDRDGIIHNGELFDEINNLCKFVA